MLPVSCLHVEGSRQGCEEPQGWALPCVITAPALRQATPACDTLCLRTPCQPQPASTTHTHTHITYLGTG